MILYLTDGATTLHLDGSAPPVAGCTYFPATPQPNEPRLTDRIDLILRGNAAQIRTAVRTLELLLETAARRSATRLGPKVHRYYAPTDDETPWRSEIHNGRIIWSDNPALRRLQDGTVAPITVALALILERTPYEEGPEIELPIASAAQPIPTTGGVPIANDPQNQNWIAIPAGVVQGALPAPIRLQYRNADSANRSYNNFYIGLNAFAAPGWTQVLQGEDALPGAGAVIADAAYSNAHYLQLSLVANQTSYIQWRLPAPMLAARGRYFRLLAYIQSTVPLFATTLLREHYGFMELWRSPEIALNNFYRLHDLGAAPIPPGPEAADAAPVVLELQLRPTLTGVANLDYIALLGVDAYRRAHMPGMSTLPNDIIELDDIEQRYTQIEADVGRHPILTPLEQPLRLWPNLSQRLHILVDTQTGNAPIHLNANIRLWHRPRKLTV